MNICYYKKYFLNANTNQADHPHLTVVDKDQVRIYSQAMNFTPCLSKAISSIKRLPVCTFAPLPRSGVCFGNGSHSHLHRLHALILQTILGCMNPKTPEDVLWWLVDVLSLGPDWKQYIVKTLNVYSVDAGSSFWLLWVSKIRQWFALWKLLFSSTDYADSQSCLAQIEMTDLTDI